MANQNPATMSDEELDEVLAEAGIATPPDPNQPNEEPEPENPEPPVEEEAPPEEPEEEEQPEEAEPEPKKEEKAPSRREQLRIQQLLARYGKPQPEAPFKETLPAEGLDLEQELEADPEVKKRLLDDRQRAADLAYQRGLQQANSIQFRTRLDIDAPRVEAEHPLLDKNSEKFRPDITTSVNTFYLDMVGFQAADPQQGTLETVQRPNIRYADFTEALFELAHEIAQAETVETKKNIAKQAAKTGLRPDGSRAKKLDLTKPPEQMTDEELDAIIAQAIPPR